MPRVKQYAYATPFSAAVKPVSDWENYHSFLEALRAGSYAKAALKTGLTYPTIRRRIEDLEHSLGMPLFTRAADGLCPTAGARRLQREVEAMESAAQTFLRIAAGEAGGAAGVVRIACGELTAQELLPLVARELSVRHPRLGLEVTIGNPSIGVLRGEADIALQNGRPTHKALCGRRVGTVHIGLFAHRRYIDGAGTPSRVADLKGHALIGAETDGHWKRVMTDHGLDLTFGDFAYRASSPAAQWAAIRAGIGIGLVQTAIAVRTPDMVRLLADHLDLRHEPWVVNHEDLRHEPRIRVVIDALVDQIASYNTSRPDA
jgi:DNA-binding transcriptional LysR family regulator